MFGDLSLKKEKEKKRVLDMFSDLSLNLFFFWGGGWLTNERPRTDHLITEPMRGLEKNRMGEDKPINKRQHTDIGTTRPTWPRGPNW